MVTYCRRTLCKNKKCGYNIRNAPGVHRGPRFNMEPFEDCKDYKEFENVRYLEIPARKGEK